MNLESEDDVKRALNIESWRNLSKDRFLAFVAEMPKMDKEVALKIVGQFPDFKALVTESLNSLERQFSDAHRQNWKSQNKVHRAFKGYRDTLNRELDRDNLTPEERFGILDLLRQAVDKEYQKDTENKAFVLKMASVAGGVVVVVVAAAIAFVGGKVGIGPGSDRS